MRKSISGILLDVYYKNEQLWLTLKTKDNKKKDFIIDFNPYFYISFFNSDSNFIKKQIKALNTISAILEISKVEKVNISDIYKLEFNSINELIEIRNALQNQELNITKYSLYEYDISLIYRFFIDKSISNFRNVVLTLDSNKIVDIKCDSRVDLKTLNIGCFDIEVLVNEDLKFPEIGENPIISISYINNTNKKEVFFLANLQDSKLSDVESKLATYINSNSINLNLFNSEKELLIKFKEFIEKEDPDILYTYNGIFDLEYISKSYNKLTQEELTFNSRSIIFNKSKNKKVHIEGIVHFDVYRLMKLLNYFQVFNYSKFDLNSLYSKITGKDKLECSPKDMREKYLLGDYESIIKYNLDDCFATVYLADNYISTKPI
jgi:DNA polymerase elongation subunit (family B)